MGHLRKNYTILSQRDCPNPPIGLTHDFILLRAVRPGPGLNVWRFTDTSKNEVAIFSL